jgi:hypothetical protein
MNPKGPQSYLIERDQVNEGIILHSQSSMIHAILDSN